MRWIDQGYHFITDADAPPPKSGAHSLAHLVGTMVENAAQELQRLKQVRNKVVE